MDGFEDVVVSRLGSYRLKLEKLLESIAVEETIERNSSRPDWSRLLLLDKQFEEVEELYTVFV